MATADEVVVELKAKVDSYNANLIKAQRTFDTSTGRMTDAARRMSQQVTGSFAAAGRGIASAFAVTGGIRGIQVLVDSVTRIDNALKVAGLSGQALEKVYGRLQQSAQKNAAPLETLVTLYGRVSLVQKELNVSQEEMLAFTDNIAMALRVAGTDAQSASGALLQLSQALGSGVVRAEEFNSILEGALPIAQAAAAGLKEAGGSVAALRQLVVDGKISSEAFFRAIEAGSSVLEGKLAGATLTTSQGFTLLANSLIDATREFLQGSLAAEGLGEAFEFMANKINSVDFSAFGAQARELIDLINQVREAMGWLQSAGANLGSALGLDAVGDFLTGGKAFESYLGGAITVTNQRGIQSRIEGAFAENVDIVTGLTEDAVRKSAGNVVNDIGKTGRLPSTAVTPVSLSDFAAPAGKGKGKGGGRGGKTDAFQSEIRQIRERTELLLAETSAQALLNPLVNDYEYAITKASATQELLNFAKRAGLEVTPQLKGKIDELAEGYANATVEANKLAEKQSDLKRSAEEFNALGKDVLGGFISDLKNGTSAADALANALNKIGDKLLDMALNSLFSSKSGGGGIGGFLASLFGGFRANGGPVGGGKAYVVGERGPELFMPGQAGSIIPNIPNMTGGGQSGSVVVNFNPVIDNRGASVEAVARNEMQIEKLKRDLPAIVTQSVRKAQKSNVKLN